jgi:IS1 family transposase/transposase-like protein
MWISACISEALSALGAQNWGVTNQYLTPACAHSKVIKHGFTRAGQQRFRCTCCGKSFTPNAKQKRIPLEIKQLIPRFLDSRLSIRQLARKLGISRNWLQVLIWRIYQQTPTDLGFDVEKVLQAQSAGLEWVRAQADELWSFVGSKQNRQWVWLALDSPTRCISPVYVGSRNARAAKQFWESIPKSYREIACFDTDLFEPYKKAIPAIQHVASGKETGYTAYIERFNCTLRQMCSRLVRKSLSFSKSVKWHLMAIQYTIWQYNLRMLNTQQHL